MKPTRTLCLVHGLMPIICCFVPKLFAGEGSAASEDDSGNEWEYKADKSVRPPPAHLHFV
jgi:hypothetical protein